MTRYYFHLVNAVGRTQDFEGEEMADLEAVRECAIRSIRSIVSDEALQGRIDLRGRIEVTSDDRHRVMVVPFTDAINILSGPPRADGEQAGILM
jgi:hypothetical protein